MATNAIPKTPTRVVPLARRAKAAAEVLEALIGLEQNTGARIGAELRTLIGSDPSEPEPVHGLQGVYSDARSAWALARKQYRGVENECREYCRVAVNLLRTRLGNSWNSQWEAAGFARGSLAIPAHPAALLTTLKDYFLRNPEYESVEFSVSSERSHQLAQALEDAARDMDAKKAAQAARKQERDRAFARLRRRLGNLREELALQLEPDDARWYEFGFKRPVDGQYPEPVKELALEAGLPGEVRVRWEETVRAKSYRVERQIVGAGTEPVFVGRVDGPTAIIAGLPSGATVKVLVRAKNDTGEALPAEAQMVVP